MEMTPQRWKDTSKYLVEVFGRPDPHLAGHPDRAKAAGLPEIAVSADVGRLLQLLTSMTNAGRGASVAVEVGTLGGYSGIWIARGLAPGGRLYTIEPDPRHVAFARQEFAAAGVAERVTLIEAPAPAAIHELAERLGPDSVDLVFLDAIKPDYRKYMEAAEPMLKRGGLVIADNALGSGSWWIDEKPGISPDRDAIDTFNRWIGSNRNYFAACIPIREGVIVARHL